MPEMEEVLLKEGGGALTVVLLEDVGRMGLVVGLLIPAGDDCKWELPVAEVNVIMGEVEEGTVELLLVVVIGMGVVDVAVVVVIIVVCPSVAVAVVELVAELADE